MDYGEGKAGHNDFPADLVECKNVFEHQLSKAALALALALLAPGWAVPEITLIKLSVLSVFLLLACNPLSPSVPCGLRTCLNCFVYLLQWKRKTIFHILH